MKNSCRLFIIDADIARSSGISEHPVSSSSRVLLENLSKQGHKIAMCPSLRAEWKKHRSRFATTWLSSMIAKKRVIFIPATNSIKEFIALNMAEGKNKEIALKDVHLVDGALHTDKLIASNDNTARIIFSSLTDKNGLIGTIAWFNSVDDRDFLTEDLLVGDRIIPAHYYLK